MRDVLVRMPVEDVIVLIRCRFLLDLLLGRVDSALGLA